MANERKTSTDAWEAYIAAKGIKPTIELIDAFFEGYKAGILDGADLQAIARSVVEKLP